MLASMIQLACTHCGNRFEMEALEGALCPSCGWSSSVMPAADLKSREAQVKKIKSETSFAWLPSLALFALKVAAVVIVAALLVIVATRFWKARHEASTDPKSLSLKQDFKVTPSQSAPTALTPDEQAVLTASLKISPQVQLADDEQKLLQRAVDLTAGNVEKLPSVNWTLDQFKQFVAAQEKKFRIPLPRSYKKSLEELFQKTYATAYDLFVAGKIQQARDAYVESLGFPVYDNDVRKHRAVVLTMLRSFLNDTIAKIGAMNFTLARQNVSSLAEQVGENYTGLQQQIRSGEWGAALGTVEKLEALLPDPTAMIPVLSAPPYGVGFAKVDADMQPTLLSLLQVPAWAFDLNDLKSDLSVKKTLLSKLADPDRAGSVQSYHQAVERIQTKSWAEACAFLKQVKSPPELRQDAEQKIALIEKLTGGSSAAHAG